MLTINENTHSLVPLKDVVGDLSELVKDNARLILERESGEHTLHVLPDIDGKTEFYHLRKQLRKAGINHQIVYSNRQDIEKIGHLFNSFEKISETEQSEKGLQEKVLRIIEEAVERGSSDIHFRVEHSFTHVLFRIDSVLTQMNEFEMSAETGKRIVQTLYNTMCNEQTTPTLSYNQSSDAKIKEEFVQGFGLSTGRVATRPGGSGKILVVVRLVNRRKKSLTLAELGLTDIEQRIIRSVLAKPAGAIFSSGPTGHGKSTLSQCMAEIYTSENPGMNMLTIEDPIESPISGAFQTPLMIGDRGDNKLVEAAWGKAMANVMRLDPDSIYVGEVRDSTSATGAVEASQTGHSVITTIHTSHPIDIIQRLRRLGVDQDLLTDATLITCLIGLRLVKLSCPDCKIKYTEHKNKIDTIFTEIIDKYTDVDSVYLQNPLGCATCNSTGIKGRTGVFEVIETDYQFMRLYDQKGKFAAWKYWREKGGVTLCQNVIRLINAGVVDPVIAHKSVCNLDRDDKFNE